MPSFGSNQWVAILIGLIPIGLGYSLVLWGKLGGTDLMSYCQISTPIIIGIALGGSAAVKILAKKEEPPAQP